MRTHEFYHDIFVVTYSVAKWHPNDGPYYDTFADDIIVYKKGEVVTDLSDRELEEIKAACHEDMQDRHWGFEE